MLSPKTASSLKGFRADGRKQFRSGIVGPTANWMTIHKGSGPGPGRSPGRRSGIVEPVAQDHFTGVEGRAETSRTNCARLAFIQQQFRFRRQCCVSGQLASECVGSLRKSVCTRARARVGRMFPCCEGVGKQVAWLISAPFLPFEAILNNTFTGLGWSGLLEAARPLGVSSTKQPLFWALRSARRASAC